MNQKHAAVLLADGFEEIEAVAAIDVLRRAGVKVWVAAVGSSPVQGSHGMVIHADVRLGEVADHAFDAVVLPGGMPGALNLAASQEVLTMLRRTRDAGGIVAAVCAGPLALHAAGLTAGRRVTSHPSVADRLTGAIHTGRRVETDGQMVTGQAAGSAIEFALAVVAALGLPEQARAVADAMLAAPSA